MGVARSEVHKGGDFGSDGVLRWFLSDADGEFRFRVFDRGYCGWFWILGDKLVGR